MNVNRLMLAAGIPFASLAPCFADPAPIIHYAPAENLEHGASMTACRFIAILTPGYRKGRWRAGAKS
jgi:hypothetical protein